MESRTACMEQVSGSPQRCATGGSYLLYAVLMPSLLSFADIVIGKEEAFQGGWDEGLYLSRTVVSWSSSRGEAVKTQRTVYGRRVSVEGSFAVHGGGA